MACLAILLLNACSSQIDNAANRRLQNLSARYNYIYNSNVLLNNYEESLPELYKDNYEQLLPIYIAPPAIDYLNDIGSPSVSTELEDITHKAQSIVNEKSFSNYIDEAYILLGKTNFYKGNYYNAAEYFDYVERAYRNDKAIYLNALHWKARAYMQLQNEKMASRLLDSVIVTLDSVKRGKGAPLATLAQMSIDLGEHKKAIDYLEGAIKESNDVQSRTRWPYILGQLYELEKNYEASIKNYTKVEKSNAPFEMYFNARLSKIRVTDFINNQTSDRKIQLLKLTKDDKNLDYTDQIYYEIAEDYYADEEYLKAEEYYKRSAKESVSNNTQKGISYLKLADLYFKELSNYVNAKLYYDSALNTLPKNYRNYAQIQKKAQNLEYLSDRYKLINTQDTLQFIASLNDIDREKKIAQLFEQKVIPIVKQEKTGRAERINTSASTFYFNNLTAISRGYTDFKKRWGNRVLENNWRQSIKSSSEIAQQIQRELANNAEGSDINNDQAKAEQILKIKTYTALLPLTPEQLRRSNQQIKDAYFEIAGFYQHVLEDFAEAAKTYETILKRFPENSQLETIYYSLYLSYKSSNPSKSDNYKNLILSKYPNSSFARTILDPSFSMKQNALDLEINKLYNNVFSAYEKKEYKDVIVAVTDINNRFPGNSLQIQYDYLQAISIGKTEPLDSLLIAFNKITQKHPKDSLITPLIKDHLAYINEHISIFKARKIALVDFDEAEPKFIAQKVPVLAITPPQTVQQSNTVKVPSQAPATLVKPTIVLVETIPTPVQNSIKTDGLFTTLESKTYYFVVNVASMQISVSSSRFGIGQFNRGNFAGTNLRHQLIDLPEDQIIYVANFNNLAEVRAYSEEITQQLPKIMKVPASIYKSFFISKENFDKIKDRATLNQYLEFFKANYDTNE
ncbi:MAG: gliding motility protein [Pedobacter sp.]|nr:MAG: gliding motility protein [Pedobacter sp.]